ncbi:MAG TPA: sulfite dehydrogenase [Methylibium sp.]|uniref:sulfite dehydrogenase n=1 Tax=Methylibium sp. TaxID=2067992 RepID=UPI002DBAFD57|nr:sulfite dehydrogenase [Methylibium sp.]HEU4460309.1 sulfite dehydrogenase [Methylibium sp.]
MSDDALTPAAGGGLLHRRALLHRGLVLATALPAAASADEIRPEWMKTPGRPFTIYGQPSKHEQQVIRRISGNRMLPGNGVAMTPLEDLEGFITPSGLHFERHHNGVPEIDPARHGLLIHGKVKQPMQWSVDRLLRYPMASRLVFIECGGNSNAGWHPEPIQRGPGSFHGLISCSEWTGVPLSLLLDEAGADAGASWAIAEGADAFAMNVSVPLAKLRDDAIVALFQNGERLRPENGYPLRLVLPGWEGVLNVKWLRRLHLTSEPVMARNETAKYTELQADGRARQFSFVMEVKSLITSPSHGQRLKERGFHEIRGYAWSGRGKVRRVEVSADGGRSWAEAALQEPVLAKCMTRFRAAWRWDGSPAVLKSRAIDATGAVQPERAALVAQRGLNGYFHYNGIVAWAVDDEGAVTHVYA